tara:strand:- start:215 stop:1591 length:1377 start_codon:yes stop_codon:yes gene_type:complete
MGKVWKAVKKTVKKVAKPITKIVKRTARRIKKIGKAVMKGVSKISNKLGPIGMIALSIAMPYALGGLSSMIGTAGGTTGFMNSSNLFLKSIGTIGNQIRSGYQAFNTAMSGAKSFIGGKFKGITDSISKGFSNLMPKGNGNIFKRISDGAKNLYNAGKNKLKSVMPKPLTAPGGSVDLLNQPAIGPASYNNELVKTTISNTRAADLITRGAIDGSQLTGQSLSGKGGWFTKVNQAGVNADKLVTETINDAYKIKLDGFGKNATRMFNDVKNKALELDTYVSDEQIGNYITENAATTQNALYDSNMDFAQKTGNFSYEIEDLSKTGDYNFNKATMRPNPNLDSGMSPQDASYTFNGNETFKNQAVKNATTGSSIIKKLRDQASSLLNKEGQPEEAAPLPFYGTTYDGADIGTPDYQGTSLVGSDGGSLVEKVYGAAAMNRMKTYYRNMNILNSGESIAP